MVPECRHILPNGRKCFAPALRGTHFCYFHTNLHKLTKKPASAMDSIQIPLALEDRCSLQVAIAQVLRAIVSNSIDRPRASLLLYGLQLASQNVDHTRWALPFGGVQGLTHTRDGEELAMPPQKEEEDDDEEDDEDEEDDDE